jgi:hypothetical protein
MKVDCRISKVNRVVVFVSLPPPPRLLACLLGIRGGPPRVPSVFSPIIHIIAMPGDGHSSSSSRAINAT